MVPYNQKRPWQAVLGGVDGNFPRFYTNFKAIVELGIALLEMYPCMTHSNGEKQLLILCMQSFCKTNGRKYFKYRHSSYNAVLLYRGILSIRVFYKPKTALIFYLKRFFHKKMKKNCKNFFFNFFNFFFVFDMQKSLSESISTHYQITFPL